MTGIDNADPRQDELEQWLGSLPALADFALEPASGDASFRRYFRVASGGKTYIAMDAPPDREDCLPFVRVATWLEGFGINVPEILASDLASGFILMTDLGDLLYLDDLEARPDNADSRYADAMGALARMQEQGMVVQDQLPPFDAPFVERELALFHDWLCETHLGYQWSATAEKHWQALSNRLINAALDQPQVFVHRDYHSRNLMVSAENNPGVLDFQDAVEGPLTYDLVSLLKDCYISWPRERVDAWALEFRDLLSPDLKLSRSRDAFLRDFALMGVQRHLKAAGIFARLNHRDGKPGYLKDIPRTLDYVLVVGDDFPELGFLVELVQSTILPGLDTST